VLFGHLDYSVLIGANGTKLSTHLVAGGTELGGAFALLGMENAELSWGIALSRPVRRSRRKSVTLQAGLDVSNSKQRLMGATSSEDRIRKLSVGLSIDKTDKRGRNFFSFGLEQGLGSSLGGMENGSPLSSRSFSGADGRFTKLTADLTRVQRISPRVSLIGRVAGQYSMRPLVAGEQWSIGGADSVRGHPQSSLLGDGGFTAGLEARIAPLSDKLEGVQLALFADHGVVTTKKPGVGQKDRRGISGVGLGVRANLAEDLALRGDLAWSLGADPISGGTPTAYLQLTKSF